MAQKCLKLVNGFHMQGALTKSYFLHTIVSGKKMRVPNSKEKFISSKKLPVQNWPTVTLKLLKYS